MNHDDTTLQDMDNKLPVYDKPETEQREQRSRLISESIPQQVWCAAPNGSLIYINQRLTEYFAIPHQEILEKGYSEAIHPEDLQLAQQRWAHCQKTGERYAIDLRLRRHDGKYRWHISQAWPTFDNNNRIIEWYGTNTDITDHKVTQKELTRVEALLEESQHIAQVGGWELDVITGNLYWTAETYRLHDTSPEHFNPTVDAGISQFLPESQQSITSALHAAIHEGKDYDLELETHTFTGRKIDVRTTCRVTQVNGKTTKLTGIFQDISQHKKAQRRVESTNKSLAHANSVLKHIAHYDALTRLPNRTLLSDRLQQAMAINRRRGDSTAVAFLDLDDFKDINDIYGHSGGDQVLVNIAERIKNTLRDSDTVARIGGDEFVAVLTGLTNPIDCEPLLTRVLEAISKPIDLNGQNIQVFASIGVTTYPQDCVDAEQLLRHADQAMYTAKQAGKNCFHLFDVAKDAEYQSHREELENIRKALEKDEFILFYQPKVNMLSRQVIGAEALIRWQHPERGILAPAQFLPVIEEDDLSIDIGEWVIARALKQMQIWRLSGLNIPVSVNINALHLQQPDFVERLKAILKKFPDIEPEYLELEILETSALSDISFVSTIINVCQNIGVRFSLDDFGTGYSSLSYLKRLPAKILKIDQSFIRDMLEDSDDLAIIQGIVGLASAFGRDVIAEGVETIEHGEKLLSLGCVQAQGYGIARPMPANEMPAWAKTWPPVIESQSSNDV